jgi:hypothetical protein
METITAKANKSKRTFTIRKYVNGKLFSKYKTTAMSKEEFSSSEHNTWGDWKDFLKNEDGYYYKS